LSAVDVTTAINEAKLIRSFVRFRCRNIAVIVELARAAAAAAAARSPTATCSAWRRPAANGLSWSSDLLGPTDGRLVSARGRHDRALAAHRHFRWCRRCSLSSLQPPLSNRSPAALLRIDAL